MTEGYVLNFSVHRLTPAQAGELAALLGRPDLSGIEVCEPGFEIDWAGDFLAQCREQVGALRLSSEAWQGSRLWLIVPDLAAAAAVVLTEIHGRAGHFPSLIWRRPKDGVFGIGGVASLDDFRMAARRLR